MFLVDLSDLFNALAVLQKLIAIRWWREHENREGYLEVRRDIQILEQNFYALQEVIREVLANCPDLAPATPVLQWGLRQILGNFNETLNESWELLGDQESLPSHDWQPPGKDEVVLLHDRIVALNIKLSIALGSLNLSSFSDSLQITIQSCTQWPGREPPPSEASLPEDKVDFLAYQIDDFKSAKSPTYRRGSVSPAITIPQPVDKTLTIITTSRYDGLASIPIINGISEIVFYLDQATEWHNRRQAPANIRNNHSCKMAYIMWSHWLLRAIQAADEYQTATSQLASGDPQLKLPYYGMTLPRFFSQMGEKILQVYKLLLAERPDPYPATHIQTNIERERNTWLEYVWKSATQKDNNNPRTGGKIMRGRLKNADPAVREYLEVFSEDGAEDSEGCLNLIISATSRSDRVYKMDLGWVHVGPNPAACKITDDVYPLIFKQNRSSGKERGDLMSFVRRRDLFRFQELVTGYQVVDDLPNTQITCQYSQGEDKWKVWKGTQSTETGRIQLWNSTNRPHSDGRAAQLWESDSVLSSPSKRDSTFTLDTLRPRSIVSIPSIASKPPKLPPLHFSQVCVLSVQSAAPSLRAPSSIIESSRSSVKTAAADSFSTTRLTSVTSVIPINRAGNVGAIIEAPDCPYLVILLSEMMLVVDINDETNIDPRLCDCQEEEGSSSRYPRCTRVVLKSSKKHISSRRSPTTTTTGWNIASAGRYQRNVQGSDGGLEDVKKLRLVILEFGSVEDRLRFVKHFQDLQELYRVNRRGV